MYTLFWVFGNAELPIKDISFNPLPVITYPEEGEELTLEEIEERRKNLSEKYPSQQFVVREKQE